jgi:hypothetical protein
MSATIVPFIKDTVFGPEAVARMGEAFDLACAASAQLGPVVQEVIAARIISLAKTGERNPQILCDHALEGLGSSEAQRA